MTSFPTGTGGGAPQWDGSVQSQGKDQPKTEAEKKAKKDEPAAAPAQEGGMTVGEGTESKQVRVSRGQGQESGGGGGSGGGAGTADRVNDAAARAAAARDDSPPPASSRSSTPPSSSTPSSTRSSTPPSARSEEARWIRTLSGGANAGRDSSKAEEWYRTLAGDASNVRRSTVSAPDDSAAAAAPGKKGGFWSRLTEKLTKKKDEEPPQTRPAAISVTNPKFEKETAISSAGVTLPPGWSWSGGNEKQGAIYKMDCGEFIAEFALQNSGKGNVSVQKIALRNLAQEISQESNLQTLKGEVFQAWGDFKGDKDISRNQKGGVDLVVFDSKKPVLAKMSPDEFKLYMEDKKSATAAAGSKLIKGTGEAPAKISTKDKASTKIREKFKAFVSDERVWSEVNLEVSLNPKSGGGGG